MPTEYSCLICGHNWKSHRGEVRRPNICPRCKKQNWFWQENMPLSFAPDIIIQNVIKDSVIDFLGTKKSKIVNRKTIDLILCENVPGWANIYASRRGRILTRFMMTVDPSLTLPETGSQKIFYRI